jgi:hypothetical protein
MDCKEDNDAKRKHSDDFDKPDPEECKKLTQGYQDEQNRNQAAAAETSGGLTQQEWEEYVRMLEEKVRVLGDQTKLQQYITGFRYLASLYVDRHEKIAELGSRVKVILDELDVELKRLGRLDDDMSNLIKVLNPPLDNKQV